MQFRTRAGFLADDGSVGSQGKVVSLPELQRLVQAAQVKGEAVVLCHGCFDIVHPGHIRHLQHAARQGDRLAVTITGDGMMNKGDARPLIPQELRAENLAALDCVDWVGVNPDQTAAGVLERLRPDVYVKGREYEQNRDPRFAAEKEVVASYGGRVVFSSGDVIFSSTALIAAIEESASPFQARLRQLVKDNDLSVAAVDELVSRFRDKSVVVVGDTIIDTYVLCDRPEVAGESPIMTLRPVEYRSFDGGAAIIARHLAAMGARPILVTALPRTPDAEALRQRLAEAGIETRWVESDRPIIEKQRFLVGTTKVMKLDLGQPLTLDEARQQRVIELVESTSLAPTECDAAIIADFGQGLFTSSMLRAMCRAIRPRIGLISADVSGRRSNLLAMESVDLICPSEGELRDAVHNYDKGLTSVVWEVLDRTAARAAIITMGDEGLTTFQRRDDASASGGEPDWRSRLTAEHVPAFAPYAIDQLGCGDSLLAAATLTLAAGGSLVMAAIVGSAAAAVQSQRLGNAAIGAAELRRGLRRLREGQLTYIPEPAADAAAARQADETARDQLHRAHA